MIEKWIQHSQKILIISGPTASGKSDLAQRICDSLDTTIINSDALQLYKGLPILSAQPTLEEQKKIKHLLYSILQPSEISSVGTWLKLVKSAIDESWKQNKIPVVVGGTGMYISKLVEGISPIPEISTENRDEARRIFSEIGQEEFLQKLQELEGDEEIMNLDKQRLIRAYEVLLQTGKSISWWQKQSTEPLFDSKIFLHINLNPNREKLYENCNKRFRTMLKSGACQEVQNLIDQGISDDQPITKTLGFYEIRDFISGKISEEKTIELATRKTRNYAKRQLTWFRHHSPEKVVFADSIQAFEFALQQTQA